MALDTIAKMVKAAGPPQIQPHLADLSVTMLESLSGMEVCLNLGDHLLGGWKRGRGGRRDCQEAWECGLLLFSHASLDGTSCTTGHCSCDHC